MFSKLPSELTSDDIQRVADEHIQEGSGVELKATLPARKGDDPWIAGQDRIGDYARNELIAEVIAFANAHGGWLLLGIEETKTKPSRAQAINPIRDCAELADRLRLQCRDCIEPRLSIIEVAGVPTTNDGAGVIVFRVPASHSGPHRHAVTRECYRRHADRSEKMTMREIQDLTLHLDRSTNALKAVLEQRRSDFGAAFSSFAAAAGQAFAIRVTAVPVVSLFLNRVHKNDAVRPPLIRIHGTKGEDYPVELFVPFIDAHQRPILRGTSLTDKDDGHFIVRETYNDGLIEYGLFRVKKEENDHFRMPVIWVMGLLTNAMCAVETFRVACGAPDAEFALEVEIITTKEPVTVGIYGRDVFGFSINSFPSGFTRFPLYSLGPQDEFSQVSALFENDFWNAVGVDDEQSLVVDFEQAFRSLGIAGAEIASEPD